MQNDTSSTHVQPIENWGGGSAGCSGLDRNRAGAPKGYAIELAQYHLEPFPHCQRQALVK